jgi:penicillin amidase
MRDSILPAFLFVFVLAFNFAGCFSLNDYQREGSLDLPGLKETVRVVRDEKGMAYIYARNMGDALMAQGFVTAQDRLFQMELARLFAEGRISELVGEKGKPSDITMRTLGFYRNARRHAALLDPGTRAFFESYIQGVNAYIKNRPGSRPVEFRLSGITPGIWSVADSLAILYYLSWSSSANLVTEVIAQALVDRVGTEKAREIFPLNINPDDPSTKTGGTKLALHPCEGLHLAGDPTILSYLKGWPLHVGSNNWAVGPGLSASGKPILANDPHLDIRMLPGPLYPTGIVRPEGRAVGISIPGVPGMAILRNDHVAVGVTNAYGDSQDLYVERLDPDDPDRYMEGAISSPFQVIEETLKIKDKDAPAGYRLERIKIRLTKRGPVVSGVLPGLGGDRVISLRWAPFETMGPFLGIDRLLTAESTADVRDAVAQVNLVMFNFVFADTAGNFGWQASGKLPVRAGGDGTLPWVVRSREDNWTGWIPVEAMPQAHNPPRGWVGTCNHMTVEKGYAYYYSSHFSPSYRYRRLKELLGSPGTKSAEDHWQFQRDTTNLMAEEIAPFMARALLAHGDTRKMGEILNTWDCRDRSDGAAPTIFQAVYRKFALSVFVDELGGDLAGMMLDDWYFWQERLGRMVVEGTSPWFDDVQTKDRKETRDQLFHLAGLEAARELGAELGGQCETWSWGKVHRLEWVSPIRREGIGKGLLGSGPHALSGSGETLLRGLYEFNDPFKVTIAAALRMVADLGDNDKVLAVMPGGVSGRILAPHSKDQIEAYLRGDKVYWWFSDREIEKHCRSTLLLVPALKAEVP